MSEWNENARGTRKKYSVRRTAAAIGTAAATLFGGVSCSEVDTSAADAMSNAAGEVPSTATCNDVIPTPSVIGRDLAADPAGLARATERLVDIQHALCRTALGAAQATVRDIRNAAPGISFSAKDKDVLGDPTAFSVEGWASTSGLKIVTFGKTADGRLDLSAVRDVSYTSSKIGVSVHINHNPSRGPWTISGSLQPGEGFSSLPPSEIATGAEAEEVQRRAHAAANHIVGTP